jgi:methanesulfonate monooxygenase small subunit
MDARANDIVNTVKDTIYKACLLLDDQKWTEWLELCDQNFQYAITAFSPEIHYDMTYFSADHARLVDVIATLPKHNTDHSPLKRHVTVYTVEVDEREKTATAVTSLVVYQNLLDGTNAHIDAGDTRLFLVGRYLDKFRIDAGKAKFVQREVRLDTRRLDKGSHWPI